MHGKGWREDSTTVWKAAAAQEIVPWSAPPHDRLMSRKWFCLAKWQKTNGKQSDTPRFVKGYLAYLENAQISIVKLKIINVTGLPNKGCITWSKIYHLTKLSTWTATGAIAALRPSGAYTAICIDGAKTTWCTSLRLGLNGKNTKLKSRIFMNICYLWIALWWEYLNSKRLIDLCVISHKPKIEPCGQFLENSDMKPLFKVMSFAPSTCRPSWGRVPLPADLCNSRCSKGYADITPQLSTERRLKWKLLGNLLFLRIGILKPPNYWTVDGFQVPFHNIPQLATAPFHKAALAASKPAGMPGSVLKTLHG